MPKIITRKSNIRLKEYDYSQSNYYFITACCENKLGLLGAVMNNGMVLNGAGEMVEQTLIEIQLKRATIVPDGIQRWIT